MAARVVDIATKAGLVSMEDQSKWLNEGFYIPFYRLIEENPDHGGFMSISGLVKQTAYKRLKGADIPLNDLVVNVIMNWNHVLSASMKNLAAADAIESAEAMGLAREVKGKYRSKKAVFIREEGKRKWYEFSEDPEAQLVLDSLMSLNWRGLNNFAMKAARKFKRALTMGVTASPEFKIANLLRDSIQAVAVADMSTNVVGNIKQGWIGTNKKNDNIIRMTAGGGAFGDSGYIYGTEPEALEKIVRKDLSAKDRLLDSPNKVKKMWSVWQDFGSRLENVNRAANFEQYLSNGGSLLEANFNARDHLDFMRTGSFTAVRALTQIIPFLNARMQGLDKLFRAGADKNQRRQFATVVTVYGLASILLYLYMKDDDDYEQAPQWERDTYHLFKIPGSDLMYRIPRPFEVGFMATIMERAVEQMVDDNVHGGLFWERLWHGIGETLAFNPIPQIISPAIEVQANKSFFTDRPIESVGMKNLSPENRKHSWTSDTAVGMSKVMDAILWEDAVLSPVQVEHLVNGYLGWAGGFMLASSDLIYRGLTGAPEPPSRRVQDITAVGRFARRGPSWTTSYANDFYENLTAVNRAYYDIRDARRTGEFDKMAELIQSDAGKIRWRKAYNKVQRELSDINKKMSIIRDSRTLTGEQKRTSMDRLLLRKARLTKSIVKRSASEFQ
jgi:hypothetical protein